METLTLSPEVVKVIFYIILQEIYGMTQGNDENGNAGYYLKVQP